MQIRAAVLPDDRPDHHREIEPSTHIEISECAGIDASPHALEFLEQLSAVYDFCWVASPGELEAALPLARRPRPLGTSTLDSLAEDIRMALVST